MTKEKVKALLDKISIRSDQVTDDFKRRVDEWKFGLDVETRRAVRPFWMEITAIAFVLGCGVTYFFV